MCHVVNGSGRRRTRRAQTAKRLITHVLCVVVRDAVLAVGSDVARGVVVVSGTPVTRCSLNTTEFPGTRVSPHTRVPFNMDLGLPPYENITGHTDRACIPKRPTDLGV